MNELKRPEQYVQFESIKPKLKEITEFYTQKVKDYQYRLKQLNEYTDALENEISVLKDTPKVEVLLDNMAKPLVEVPKIVADFIKTLKIKGIKPLMDTATFGEIGFTEEKRDEILHWINEHQEEYMRAWLYGYTVEKEQLYYLCEKNTGYYLKKKGDILKLVVNPYFDEDNEFTQSEIDELHTSSYEQIEVKP